MRSLLYLLPALALLPLAAGEQPPAPKPAAAGVPAAAVPDKKHEDTVQKVQNLLDEELVDPKQFQTDRPLAQFLEAVEKQLPKDKRITLRIDKEAFGAKAAEVAATPMRLPPLKGALSLRRVLEMALARIKVKADYGIETSEVIITTPQRALYRVVYDVRDIVAKPDVLAYEVLPHRDFPEVTGFRERPRLRQAEPAQRAALLVDALVTATNLDAGPTAGAQDSILVLNGTRLDIQSNAARHDQIAGFLQALRRVGDVAVILETKLYEVDRAMYDRVANAKRWSRADWEEAERRFLAGKAPKGESLIDRLEKQKLVQAGEKVKLDNGLSAGVLSRHHAVSCLPSPAEIEQRKKMLPKGLEVLGPTHVAKGTKAPAAVLEGVSFLAKVRVSGDRRFVWLKLTEKVAILQAIHKTTYPDGATELLTGVPILDENQYSRVEYIADGATVAMPVHYRPRSADGKERWWVLSITPRIYIEEEEEMIRKGQLPPLPAPVRP
jgi:hypothetical protein